MDNNNDFVKDTRVITIGKNGLEANDDVDDNKMFFSIPKDEAIAVIQALKNEPSKMGKNKPSHTTAYVIWTFMYGNETGFQYKFMPALLSAYTGITTRGVRQAWTRLEELGIIRTINGEYWLERCYRRAKMKKYNCGKIDETLDGDNENSDSDKFVEEELLPTEEDVEAGKICIRNMMDSSVEYVNSVEEASEKTGISVFVINEVLNGHRGQAPFNRSGGCYWFSREEQE